MKTCTRCKETKALTEFRVAKERYKDKVYEYPRSNCKECDKAVSRERALNGKQREANIRHMYNISVEEYEAYMATGCLICGKKEDLHLDHDHACCNTKTKTCGNCIRGALCKAHNMALGLFNDNVEDLLAAAAYLLQNTNVLKEVN